MHQICLKKRCMNEVNTPADSGFYLQAGIGGDDGECEKVILEMCPYHFSYLISFDLNSSFSIGETVFY